MALAWKTAHRRPEKGSSEFYQKEQAVQVAGSVERIEIHPETEEEKVHLQKLIEWNRGRLQTTHPPLYFWGDSETFSGAFIIGSSGIDYTDEDWARVAASGSEPATLELPEE